MPTNGEIDDQIMQLWDEIFTLEDKCMEELDFKCAEWQKVEPLLDKGIDAVLMHIDSMTGISAESLLIYKEVKEIKERYKWKIDEKRAKIDVLSKQRL